HSAVARSGQCGTGGGVARENCRPGASDVAHHRFDRPIGLAAYAGTGCSDRGYRGTGRSAARRTHFVISNALGANPIGGA
ncbi:hypothetical protein ABTD75_18875, partial [Acinetobacter baumannii]